MYFTFENPVYLWYFASLPLLIMTHFLSLRSAKRKAMRFANFLALKRIAGDRFVTKNLVVLIMRLIVLTLLIFSAAGARVWVKSDQAHNNYVLAIDVSSSMSATDFDPSRLDAAKEYASRFVNMFDQGVEVGVITFAGVTIVEQPLTSDKAALISSIEGISATKTGGTDISGALITGSNLLLGDDEKGKVIILFTDGSSTLGNYIDNSMVRAVDYVTKNKVIVNGLGIGSETGPIGYLPEFYNISSVYDFGSITDITNSTGGVAFSAFNEQGLENAFLELVEKSDEGFISLRVDLGLLVVGILLLFVEWGLINSRYRRIT